MRADGRKLRTLVPPQVGILETAQLAAGFNVPGAGDHENGIGANVLRLRVVQAAVPNGQHGVMRISLPAAPWEVAAADVPPPAMIAKLMSWGAVKRCAAPGCGCALAGRNTTGLCQAHLHMVDRCRCQMCRRRRGLAA